MSGIDDFNETLKVAMYIHKKSSGESKHRCE